MTTLISPSVLDPSLCISDLKTKRRASAIQELVARVHAAGGVRNGEALCDTLVLRERWFGTGVGKGVAVPHARSIAVIEPRLVVGRSRKGIDWEAPDGLPVQLVLLVLSPSETSEDAHIDRVARAMTLTRLTRNRARLMDADDPGAVADLLATVTS